jgi:hypothetical protein
MSYVLPTNQIFSKVDIHLVASRNLITVLSDINHGIKLILASTLLDSQSLFFASNENLPSCGM